MNITMKMKSDSILGNDDLEVHLTIDQDKYIKWTKQAWKAIFGKEPRVRAVDNPVGDEDVPNWGLVVEESFEIYPGNVKLTEEEMLERTFDVGPYVERRLKDKPHDVVRMVLTVSVPEYNYPHAPDSSDEVEIAYSVDFSDLVDRMIVLMVKHDLHNVWEGVSLEEMIADEEKYADWDK